MGALAALLAATLEGIAVGMAIDVIVARVREWLNSAAGAVFLTDTVNSKLADTDLELRFSNVFSISAVKDDLSKFVTERVNAKLGTEFTDILSVDRATALNEVGKVLTARINGELGTDLQNIYPPERLREQLGAEVKRQFSSGGDGIIPQSVVMQVETIIMDKLPGYKPARIPKDSAKAAKSRARQKRWRAGNKQVWVTR